MINSTKRARSVSNQPWTTIETLKDQVLNAKTQYDVLYAKLEQTELQKNVLKQGQTTMISRFLFNKQDNEIKRLNFLLNEKQILIQSLKQRIKTLQGKIIPTISQIKDQNSSKNHSCQQLTLLKSELQMQKIKSSRLERQDMNNNEIIKNLNIEIKNLKIDFEIIDKESHFKINQLNKDNTQLKSELFQKQKLLQSIRSSSSNNQRQKNINYTKQRFDLSISNAKMTKSVIVSNIQVQNQTKIMNNQILQLENQIPRIHKLSKNQHESREHSPKSDRSRSSISEMISQEAERASTKLKKLERTNLSLEKDYKSSQQKLKILNREMSKFKLDKLKEAENFKNKQYQFQKRIERETSECKRKNEILERRTKQLEQNIDKLKKEKQSEKNVLKSIILEFESKENLRQASFKRLMEQNQKLKAKQLSLIQQLETRHRYESNSRDLEYQKSKNKIFEKQLEIKQKQFAKHIKYYEEMIEEYKKISHGYNHQQLYISSQKNRSDPNIKKSLSKDRHKEFARNTSNKKLSNLGSNEKNLNPEAAQIIKSLQNQLTILKEELLFENQRYNILENSNRQLRKQIIKMIEQEEKLRKDLVAQRVKSRTNSNASKTSRSFSNKKYQDSLRASRQRSKSRQINLDLSRQSIKQSIPRISSSNILNLSTQKSIDLSQHEIENIKPYHNQNLLSKYSNAENTNSGMKLMREKRFNINGMSLKPQSSIIQKPERQGNNSQQIYLPLSKNFNSSKLSEDRSGSQDIILEVSSSQSALSKNQNIKELSDFELSPKSKENVLASADFSPRLFSTSKKEDKTIPENIPTSNFVKNKNQTQSTSEVRFSRTNKSQETINKH